MKAFYLSIVILTCGSVAYAQVGIGTTTPNPNAVLELVSPGKNQGFLVPRLTTAQRSALSLSASDNGLMVYDSDENRFYYWHASQWLPLRSGNDVTLEAGSGIEITGNTISAVPDGDGDATNEIQDLELTGNELRITNNESATVIDLTPFTDADGDPTNEIQDLQLVGNTLSITNNASATTIDLAPYAGTNTDNQTLSYDGSTGALDITGGNSVTITPAGPAGGILTGNYPNPDLATTQEAGNNVISAINVASTTINANRLQGTVVLQSESPTGGAISGTFAGGLQINDNAVTTAKINNAAVTNAKIADGAVGTTKIADGAVTNTKIADGTIIGAKIADGSITSADLSTTGVVADTYGSSTTVPRITVDAQGRLTAVSDVTISTGGGSPEGLAETLKADRDAQGEFAFNLSSVSIGDWGGGKGEGAPGPGALNVNGSHYRSFVVLPEGSYEVRDTDYILIGPATAQKPIEVILPDATKQPGRILMVRATNTNPSYFVQLRPSVSGQLIDVDPESERMYYSTSETNVNIAYALTVMSDGKTWWTIDRSIPPARGAK